MANTVVLTLSLAAEVFLVYALVRFARESRQNRAARRQTTLVRYSGMPHGWTGHNREASKVIVMPLPRQARNATTGGPNIAHRILSGKRLG